jgi:hypothetical protein
MAKATKKRERERERGIARLLCPCGPLHTSSQIPEKGRGDPAGMDVEAAKRWVVRENVGGLLSLVGCNTSVFFLLPSCVFFVVVFAFFLLV